MRSDGRGVLVVAGSFDARGGLQRRLDEVARLAAGKGPATVLTWKPGVRWSRERRPDGVDVIRLPALAGWERDRAPAVALANTAVSVALGTTVALLLRRRWHVAFAGGLNPEGLVAGIAARLLSRPFVLRPWLPGPVGNVARLDRSLLAPLTRRLLVAADSVVAETMEMAEELVSAGFEPGRIVLLDAGLELGRFVPPTPESKAAARKELGLAGKGVVVYCGRFDLRQKRLDLLLAAWERAGLAGWQLVLVGDGPDRQAVEDRAGGLPGVVMRPWQEDVLPFLISADVAVLPTHFEGNASALLEALACGVPVVVSATGMYRRLPPPGALVVETVDEWAGALRKVAGDPLLREELGRAGRAWVEARHDTAAGRGRLAALLGYPDGDLPATSRAR
ncbi:MAG: glycosyltransferase family 4 protein [Gaiellaceae bacterium]